MSDKYTLDLERGVLMANEGQVCVMSQTSEHLRGSWQNAAVQFWDELTAAKRDLNLNKELTATFKSKYEHWEEVAHSNGKQVREASEGSRKLRGELAEYEKAVKHWQEKAHHVDARLRAELADTRKQLCNWKLEAESVGKELADLKADDQWYVLPGGDGAIVSKLVRLDEDLYAIKYVKAKSPEVPPPAPWSQPSFGGFVSYTMPKGVKPTPLADSDKKAAEALLKCGVTPTLKLLEELAEAFGGDV